MNDIYTKEIKNYFRSLSGGALIISSEDEHTLLKWKKEGISKQDVLVGIKKAFQNNNGKRLTISGCGDFVERRFRKLHRADGKKPGSQNKSDAEAHSIALRVFRNISSAMENTDDANIKKCLEKAGGIFLNDAPGSKNIGDSIGKIRRQTCAELLDLLPVEGAENIKKRAEQTVSSSGRTFINEEERKKALETFIDKLIIKEAGLEGVFDI